jgi:hypothetical protein
MKKENTYTIIYLSEVISFSDTDIDQHCDVITKAAYENGS